MINLFKIHARHHAEKRDVLMNNWNIFIVTHQHIFTQMYEGDGLFSRVNYKFINTSGNALAESYRQNYHIINMHEMNQFLPLGAHYAESEAIFNIYKNRQYYQALDYIGFLHYDKELRLHNSESNITEKINTYLNDKSKAHISFCAHDMNVIYNQNIMADPAQPDVLVGYGLNCMDYILNDYNFFFKTNYTREDLLNRVHINMESCFLIDVKTFEKMMDFCSFVVESKKMEIFDSSNHNRLQGQLMERYFGVFLALEFHEFLNLSLPHHSHLKYC